MTMTMNNKLDKLIGLIREAMEYAEPHEEDGSYLIKLYEGTLTANGFSREDIERLFTKLRTDGLVETKQIFYAPKTTLSTYHPNANVKGQTMPDDTYNKPVYYLHINKDKLEALPSFATVRFVDEEAALYFGLSKVQLPPNRGEHAFCGVMFRYPANKPVSWDVVLEEVTGDKIETVDKESDKRAKRKIYDIYEALNARLAKEVGIEPLFVWQGTTIKRTR